MTTDEQLSAKARAGDSIAAERFRLSVATDADREEIYRARHEVYARELGQHPVTPAGALRDSLDDSNLYLVAKAGAGLAGFVSITPPGQERYSIDKYFS